MAVRIVKNPKVDAYQLCKNAEDVRTTQYSIERHYGKHEKHNRRIQHYCGQVHIPRDLVELTRSDDSRIVW